MIIIITNISLKLRLIIFMAITHTTDIMATTDMKDTNLPITTHIIIMFHIITTPTTTIAIQSMSTTT